MSELEELRNEIDKLDEIIARAYIKRLELVEKVGEYKKENNIVVFQQKREDEVLDKVSNISEKYKNDLKSLYKFILEYSKSKQNVIIK